MAAIVGGTFSILHRGHKTLLEEAIKTGEKVIIGLTSDEYAEKNKIYPPVKYSIRYRNLYSYMEKRTQNFEIHPIDDRNGNAPFEKDYHYIVVSPETYRRSLKINEMRVARGLQPLNIIKVNYVLAEDLFPISSSRIIS
ncbi:MAG: phosphopantetheine adenylyltransferase, partial [Thermoplasmata archaeon]